jgi:hypothetical protein
MSEMKASGSNEGQGSRQLPRAWRYVLVVLGLVSAVALFYGEENWRGRRAWERYQRELVLRGEPVAPAEVIPPRVPDSENFAMTPFLAPLFDFEPGTQHWRDTKALARVQNFAADFNTAQSSIKGSKLPRSNSWVLEQTDLNVWNAALHQPAKASPETGAVPVSNSASPAQAAADVLEALARYDSVLEELRTASKRPNSRFNLSYDFEFPPAVLLPHLATLKRISYMLQIRAIAALAAGRSDRSGDDLELIFALMDSTRKEPVLISHLVRISQLQVILQPLAEGLANHRWSDQQLSALQARLGQLDFIADARQTLEGERVLFGSGTIDSIRLASNRYQALQGLGGSSEDGQGAPDALACVYAVVPTGWFYLEKLNYNRAFEDLVLPTIDLKNRRLSPDAVRQADAGLARELGHRGAGMILHHKFFLGLLLPALSRASLKTAYAQAAVDEAMLACALERHRLARGKYPDSLEALAPQFIAKIPRDVITGEALKYRRTDDGHFLLYSVGWNEKDDGGVVAMGKSGGAVDIQNGDWVWR